ncbi:MAG TPA: HAD family hydrolase [Steroidobacteraceae bacterium]|nr:HAD family hydrolase [Steroidobacteraceae bacterium]
MNRSTTTVIFDVEGTLVDCVPQTLESWRQSLAESGHSFRRDELQPYSGMDGEEMLDGLLPALSKEGRQSIAKRQGELYRDQHLRAVRPFEGVRRVFVALKRAGLALAIATTCTRDELAVYDKQMRVLALTDVVTCGDDVPHGKPHPDLFRAVLKKLRVTEPSEVLTLGDTPYDARAASALGLEPVGVLTGGFSRDALLFAGCSCVLDGVRALVPHVASTFLTTSPALQSASK